MTYLEELQKDGETEIPMLCIDTFMAEMPTMDSWAALFPHMARPRCIWLTEYRKCDGYHRDSTMIYVTWDQSKFVPSFDGKPYRGVHLGNRELEDRLLMAVEPMREEEYQELLSLGIKM